MSLTKLPSNSHWWGLIEAACDGTATEDQRHETEQFLVADAQFRFFYAAYMDLDAQLRYHPGGAEPYDGPVRELHAAVVAAENGDGSPSNGADPFAALRRPASRKGSRRSAAWRWAAVAASLAALVGGAALMERWNRGPGLADVPEGRIAKPAPPAVPTTPAWAQLSRQRDGRWATSGQPLTPGAVLPNAEKLVLDEGLAELSFTCGALVTVRGPSDFTIMGPKSLHLERGELSAEVDSGQSGSFMVSTPALRVVDLGTEFSVRVSPRGDAEVDVFHGIVETSHIEDHKPQQQRAAPVRLQAGQAVRVSQHRIEAQVADRSRLLSVDSPGVSERYEQWRAWTRTIRTDPSLVAFFDFQPHSRGPLHLENAASDKAARPGKIEHGTWDEGRWPAKWALRFEGQQSAASLNLPGPFPALTLSAWVALDALPDSPGSLLQSDEWGKRAGQVRWRVSRPGRIELSIAEKGSRQESSYAIDAPGLNRPGRWIHLAAVWDAANGKVSFFLDGQCVSQQIIDRPLALVPGACRIGLQEPIADAPPGGPAFHGRFDELSAFRRALSPDEVRFLFDIGNPAGDRPTSARGDWSIFRPEDVFCEKTMAENMDLSPLAAQRWPRRNSAARALTSPWAACHDNSTSRWGRSFLLW